MPCFFASYNFDTEIIYAMLLFFFFNHMSMTIIFADSAQKQW